MAERGSEYPGEAELNRFGYPLLQARKFKEAMRSFPLNAEAYPKSSNV